MTDLRMMILWVKTLSVVFLLFKKGACMEIIGGKAVARYTRPYMALVQTKNSICGGSLIKTNWVLTAAHCKIDKSTTIKLGTVLLSTKPKEEQEFQILKCIPHPKYNKYTYDNDIQLLKLSGNAILNKAVKLLPLPKKSKEFGPNAFCNVAGWGKTANTDKYSSNQLMEVDVKILKRTKCIALWKNTYKITMNMMCTFVGQDGKDTCHGDSGGPLFCDGVFCGIVSFGSDQCGIPGHTTVYTRLRKKYISWINKETRK